MDARTGAGARRAGAWRRSCPHSRRVRRIGPVVEALEDRLVLAFTSPSNPVPIGPASPGNASPQQLGAAYQQAVAIQVATLQSLGASYAEVQAAGAQFAGRAAAAIGQLSAELAQVQSQRDAQAIAAAIRRDRDLLNAGGAAVDRAEQGLDVSRGLADQQATTEKSDIVNGLFTSLSQLVQQDQSTGAAISRSGQRAAAALVRSLDKLGARLISTIPLRRSVGS